ncbi:hypothetical protein ACIRS1_07255 [Kitasatospora sp. NPDC101176]|uniref:hypothetical protein n=1 Tax=Kitasatospora sp. NPDC101176 TaxID=3364099 RepID=UPI0037F31AB7
MHDPAVTHTFLDLLAQEHLNPDSDLTLDTTEAWAALTAMALTCPDPDVTHIITPAQQDAPTADDLESLWHLLDDATKAVEGKQWPPQPLDNQDTEATDPTADTTPHDLPELLLTWLHNATPPIATLLEQTTDDDPTDNSLQDDTLHDAPGADPTDSPDTTPADDQPSDPALATDRYNDVIAELTLKDPDYSGDFHADTRTDIWNTILGTTDQDWDTLRQQIITTEETEQAEHDEEFAKTIAALEAIAEKINTTDWNTTPAHT